MQGRESRRKFIKFAGATMATLILPVAGANARSSARRISLHNMHTGERFSGVYWTPAGYERGALREINTVLRDFRTDEVHRIDPQLLDLLSALRGRLETDRDFRVISGYRSPATNTMLAQRSGGVAKRSYHMRGMAIDVAVPDRSAQAVYRAARSLARGGAGLYQKSGFVHLDVGPVRYW